MRSPLALTAAAGLIGALLLVVSEFTTLYSVHVITSRATTGSVTVGSHDAYALVPVALLAAALVLAATRRLSRPAGAALSALAVLTLLIALVGDLPDARAHGIIHGDLLAATTPGIGLYLETLGAVLLLAAAGAALLAGERPARAPRHPRDPAPTTGRV